MLARRAASPGAPADARFGSALNAHLHFHCCVIDSVLAADGASMRFDEATALGEAEVAAVQQTVRQRVLDLFERDGLLDGDAVADMRQWAHGRE